MNQQRGQGVRRGRGIADVSRKRGAVRIWMVPTVEAASARAGKLRSTRGSLMMSESSARAPISRNGPASTMSARRELIFFRSMTTRGEIFLARIWTREVCPPREQAGVRAEVRKQAHRFLDPLRTDKAEPVLSPVDCPVISGPAILRPSRRRRRILWKCSSCRVTAREKSSEVIASIIS